jgi:hypothetical protein
MNVSLAKDNAGPFGSNTYSTSVVGVWSRELGVCEHIIHVSIWAIKGRHSSYLISNDTRLSTDASICITIG